MKTAERNKLALGALALGLVLLVGVNLLSNTLLKGLRLDLTQEQLFTISDGTREVLSSLDEPVTVRLYFSSRLGEASPPHGSFHTRVEELLEQYAALSGGKLRLETYDPQPFSEAEDRAVSFGLQGVPITQAGDLGYFGLAATNSLDGQEVVPFFALEREAFVEYDLTKLIYRLTNADKPVVGILSSLPVSKPVQQVPGMPPQNAWVLGAMIEEFFQIEDVDTNAEVIPENVDTLMVVHPKKLPAKTLYAVDQFVLRGGKALVFVDALAENQNTTNPILAMAENKRSEMDGLLKAWGVELVKDKIAGDMDAARRVNATFGGRSIITDYVAWLKLRPGNIDAEDVVSADVKQLHVSTSGVLDPVEGATTTLVPLVTTGPRSMRIDASNFTNGPVDVLDLFKKFEASGQRQTLAARITGPVTTAYPDGPPEKIEGEAPEHLAESEGPVNIVVFADTDMLADRAWVRSRDFFGKLVLVPVANNADFVVNVLDNLNGSGSLIGLRGRGRTDRPFHLVEDIRLEAEQRYRAKEEELVAKLKDVQQQLDQLQTKGEGTDTILSDEERSKIEGFRGELVAVRRELRDVQQALREDIDRLDSWLKFLNIAGVPLVLAVVMVVVTVVRRNRRAAA